MRSTIQALADYVSEYSPVLLPAVVFVTTAAAEVSTPIPHSLLISSLSWGLIWGCSAVRVGLAAGLQNVPRKRLSWTAGALFALAQICARASLDKEAIWWMKALLPASIYVILESNLILKNDGSTSSESTSSSDPIPAHGSARLLAIVTISAGFAMSASYITSQTTALGLNSVLFLACALVALESAIARTKDEKYTGTRGFVSANGSFSRRNSSASAHQEHPGTCLRDTAAVAALACGVGALVLESFRADTLSYDMQIDKLGGDWRFVQNLWLKIQFILAIGLGAVQNAFIFVIVDQRHALFTSIILLSACLSVRLLTSPSLWSAWFTTLSGLSLIAFAEDQVSHSQQTQSRIRRRLKHLILLLSFASLVPISMYALRKPVSFRYLNKKPPAPLLVQPPMKPFEPLRLESRKSHPVEQLIRNAESDFTKLLERQSKSLHDAVAEYRRRYRLHPPPHFDVWYEFARRKGVQLIDEFDTIHELMLPFWGLQPATIRARAREAIGNNENMIIAMLIRDGQVVKIERGEEWQQKATTGMVKEFVQHLPDMDLAFNIHDEPRVIVPHDRLAWLMDVATNQRLPKASSNNSPKNAFSSRPKDVNDGKMIEEARLTRFNVFAHQPTWTHSRASCAPDSPARIYEETPVDNLTSYALGDLGFVYNQSAFMDICMSPSFSETYGFFDRPNAYNLVQELFPIFSQSKIGSYQDIIYPSPWYWAGKVIYDEEKEFDWEKKTNSLYWRGSTTGGYSKKGGWRRQHRQHVVQRMNALDTATILTNAGGKGSPDWRPKDIKREELKDLIDVRFSHVGQCDESDCDAQKEFFQVTERVDPQDAWQWKHLLDMDGNAFSGRFYTFLKSKSLVYKMAVFQEWHKDWLKPWVHYIPLSLRGNEWLETVRYFSVDEEGQAHAPEMAMRSREWANQALRNEDFEVWFFRVLLEYGRVIDENRESIGYAGP